MLSRASAGVVRKLKDADGRWLWADSLVTGTPHRLLGYPVAYSESMPAIGPGYRHGIMLVDTFYENVEGPDGKSKVIQFTLRDRETMLVACLWSHWKDPAAKEPDLISFAAITDEPEPEVTAAGHDRTIINIKPEHVDAWLDPEPGDLAALYAIFDDKRHPYYEHRLAA